MSDHDDIVRLLHRAVDSTPARDEQITGIGASARRHRTLRRFATAAGAAAVVAIVLTAAVVVSQQPRPARLDLAESPPAPREAPADAGWSALPDAPLDTRWGAFSYAQDDELVVWGGYAWGADGAAEGPRADGALYRNNRWSPLPESPLSPRMRTNGAAGWIDGALWIVGGTGGPDGRTPLRDAAAYRLEEPGSIGRWRELPAVPEPIVGGAVVDDEFMVVAQRSGGVRVIYALSAGAGQWEKFAELPPPQAVENSDLHVLARGRDLILVGQGEMLVFGADLPRGVANGGIRGYTDGPDHVLGNVRAAAVTGDRVVVVLPEGTFRYELTTDRWTRIAEPLRPDPPQPIPLVKTGDGALVAVDVASGAVHALLDGGWRSLPALDHPRVDAAVGATWTLGEEPVRDVADIIVWGGMGSEEAGSRPGIRLRVPQDDDW